MTDAAKPAPDTGTTSGIWELPDDGQPYQEIDDSPPTSPPPDKNKPYMWLDGEWILIETDGPEDPFKPAQG
jgi:hypothetical protein